MRAMTDLDTSSAVVWPKWCYSGKHTESEVSQELALNNNNNNNAPIGKDKAQAISAVTISKFPTANDVQVHREDNMTSDSTSSVKCERLSPDPGSDAPSNTQVTPSPSTSPKSPATTHITHSPSVSPKSPASHRTRTPSYPGTPPHPAFTPPPARPNAYDRFSPAALGGVAGLPGGPGAMKQMESLMNRNCSDFMRSLAAKYNNGNPNEYYNNTTNGFFRHPLGLTPAFKHGTAPLLSVPTPPTASNIGKDKHKKYDMAPNSSISPLAHSGTSHMFPGFPGFPLVDMSSQVLLNMVRGSSTTQPSRLDNYLQGAKKRQAVTPSSPLDLSASMTAKRPRLETSNSFDVKSFFDRPLEERILETNTRTQITRSPTSIKSPDVSSTGSNNFITSSPEKQYPTQDTIGQWTVDDVCAFVGSIELCAEYVEVFREQRIDGCALPLLTEDHLISSINMKLGPALKLRSVLSRRLGDCNICLHCDHCNLQLQEKRPSSVSSGQ